MSNPSHRRHRRELALTAVLAAGALVTAAPASAEPVKAGPALANEVVVLAHGGGTTANYYVADKVSLHRYATSDGAYRGKLDLPTADAEGVQALTKTTWPVGFPLREHGLKRSADGRFLTFTGVQVPAGGQSDDQNKSIAVQVAADGTKTFRPIGPDFVFFGSPAVGAVTVDGTRHWVANTIGPATVAEGDTKATRVASWYQGGSIGALDIVDGALQETHAGGVTRYAGLPTEANTTTRPPVLITLAGAQDSAFVDTDGAAGADTAYLTRGDRGLWKFVLDGGEWKPRGRIGGSFGYVTARALDGKVEVYASDYLSTKLQKVLDTAPIGGELTTTGAETVQYAPSGTRYTGVSFPPGDGFAPDSAPYPAAPPALYPSATSVDTSLQATPKASITVDVADANTPSSELTLTASSANTTVLPQDRIEITGNGARRTITFDPAAIGTSNVLLTVKAGEEQVTATITVRATAAAPDPTAHYYSGPVDLSAALDVGGDYFLGISDEVNTVHLFKKGVSGKPITSFNSGFPGGETDFEGVTRFGNTVVWSGSHGNNRSGSQRPERRFLAFQTITGSGDAVDLDWSHSYTRLWDQWKTWDAGNGHGLGANYLKFNTATVRGLIPNAPFGFNVEGLTMAPGSQTTAWFGMRAPTITGADGIERALILPVTNIDKLTSNSVDAQFGAPIFLDLGGRSIRDISKNAADQYLISAGTGDTDDSLKNWALYTWDGNPAHDPKMVKELPTDESNIGAWEGIAELPTDLVAGSRVLLTADSGDTGLGKSYGQYVTLDEPHAAPALVTGITGTARAGAADLRWDASAHTTRYFVTAKNAAGEHVAGSPRFVTGTSTAFENLPAGSEITFNVRAENEATRTANGTPAKVTPTQGARVVTTTSLRFEGEKFVLAPGKLIAEISDPNATGVVRFLANGNWLRDGTSRNEFPVVNGKAEIDITGQIREGLYDLRAQFVSANTENFLSSSSEISPTLIDWKPMVPQIEIVSITGDRVAGGLITIKAKLNGYLPSELWSTPLEIGVGTRLNGSPNRTSVVGENTPENPVGAYGSVKVDAQGVATFQTRALAEGKHRISLELPNYNLSYIYSHTPEIPVTIAPAGSPAAAAPAITYPRVVLEVSGPRTVNQPLTLTARISDPSLAGTVQFFGQANRSIGNPVPVVNGVATLTEPVYNEQEHLFARFEPAADRDTTASANSMGVPMLRGQSAELPIGPATATTTTLNLTGERVAGTPLTANVEVKAVATEFFAERGLNGYVELLSGGTRIALVPVVRGKAVEPLTLPAGVHALQARYVSSDKVRSLDSASAEQTITVVAKTDAESPIGGSVPATLALTLGAPAQFEPFVPGVAKEYTAATTATVISTAGDAALSVSEPGHLVNGAFSLAQPLRVELGKAAWTAPASNDVVDVTFKQAIGANDPLRTGTYSKSLTFTLSTTTP